MKSNFYASAVCVLACACNNAGTATQTSETVRQVIGSGGGTITFNDANGGAQIAMQVPAGALTEDTTVTIAPRESSSSMPPAMESGAAVIEKLFENALESDTFVAVRNMLLVAFFTARPVNVATPLVALSVTVVPLPNPKPLLVLN